MVLFAKGQVPQHLRETGFYRGLGGQVEEESGEDAIYLDDDFTKFDTAVSSPEDLRHLLSTLRFWGCEQIPPAVHLASYLLNVRIGGSVDETSAVLTVCEEFELEIRVLKVLKRMLTCTIDKIVSIAVESDSLDALQDVVGRGFKWTEDCTSIAARSGNLSILQYLVELGCPMNKPTCNSAALGGHLECLEYAHEHGAPWDVNTSVSAATGGHLPCLKYLRERGCLFYYVVSDTAAKHGHLDCLRYAFQQGFYARGSSGLQAAALNDHMECFVFLFEHVTHVKLDGDFAENLARKGKIKYLKFAESYGCRIGGSAAMEAAKRGHIEVLEYYRQVSNQWDAEVICSAAAAGGQFECLKYVLSFGCPPCSRILENAAFSGSLECLRYAHEQGHPFSHMVVGSAASGNKMDCLVYAHEHGCPWSEFAVYISKLYGHTECLQYCIEHGCPPYQWWLPYYAIKRMFE